MNMTVDTAFKRSIETLLNWIDTQVNTNKTSVFFRSYAPVHFRFDLIFSDFFFSFFYRWYD